MGEKRVENGGWRGEGAKSGRMSDVDVHTSSVYDEVEIEDMEFNKVLLSQKSTTNHSNSKFLLSTPLLVCFSLRIQWSGLRLNMHIYRSQVPFIIRALGDKFQITVDELLDGEGAPLANIKLKMFEYCMSLSCILFHILKIKGFTN